MFDMDSGKKHRGFIYHLHPPKINVEALKFSRTFGLGGMAFLLFLIQLFTGLLLRFRYVPTPAGAYDSILSIQNDIIFGQLIRNIHHWAGMLMLIFTFLHMWVTFFAEAYRPPRTSNWIIGLAMLFVIVLMNFTGYLLPWDQLSYWAVTVATSMLDYFPVIGENLKVLARGGDNIGTTTLMNFYTFHTGLLPAVLVVLAGFHFWKVRKAGGIVLKKENITEKEIFVDTYPHLVIRELIAGLVLIAVLFLFSLIYNAPLLEKANPAYSPDPAKAPWYFLGIQELILHFHPAIGAFAIPIAVIGWLIYLPYYKFENNDNLYTITARRRNKLLIMALCGVLIITLPGIFTDELFFNHWLTGLPPLISNGLIPITILILLVYGLYIVLRKKFGITKKEWIFVLFNYIMFSYLILMLTGIWFRGAGMKLTLPW